MKSFVSQGKTILDAIDKALIIAEFPQSFTVKILEPGERFLFWWQNKSAIILFFYDVVEMPFDNKKKLKKNYSKEDAFLNKKFTNQFDAAEYTSVVKSEQSVSGIKNNQQSQQRPIFNKNKIKKEGQNEINKISKEIFIENEDKNSKLNEPQSHLGSILQTKVVVSNNIKNKKLHLPNDQEPYHRNEENKNQILKEWNSEYIVFVENWINELNRNFNLSDSPVLIYVNLETLFVKIENVCDYDYVSRKHLFSSMVILLYENLKSHFIDFDNKNYKIVIE